MLCVYSYVQATVCLLMYEEAKGLWAMHKCVSAHIYLLLEPAYSLIMYKMQI